MDRQFELLATQIVPRVPPNPAIVHTPKRLEQAFQSGRLFIRLSVHIQWETNTLQLTIFWLIVNNLPFTHLFFSLL